MPKYVEIQTISHKNSPPVSTAFLVNLDEERDCPIHIFTSVIVTFTATEHHHSLTGTEVFCL